MDQEIRYSAFISYSHRDTDWAAWLHRSVERYRTPAALVGIKTERGHDVPASLFPVFRDRDELPTASDLSETIQAALRQSRYLVVICSPNAARSPWVDAEIRYFKSLGRQAFILCLIVDGEPNACDKPELGKEECFPESLRFKVDADGKLTDQRTEPLAADVRKDKDGKPDALLKILAGLLGVNFAELKQRNLVRQRRIRAIWATVSSVLLVVMFGLLLMADQQRNAAFVTQSRFLTSIANDLEKKGDISGAIRIALEALPRHLDWRDRPYVPEAEFALESALPQLREINEFTDNGGKLQAVDLTTDGKLLLTSGTDIRIRDIHSGKLLHVLNRNGSGFMAAVFSPDGKTVAAGSLDGGLQLWNAGSGASEFAFPTECMFSLAYSHDGTKLATGCGDGSFEVWDVLRLLEAAQQHDGYRPTKLDPLPDAGPFRHADMGSDISPVTHIAFAPDDRQLLISYRNTAYLFDFESGSTKETYSVSADTTLISAEFSRDGAQIVAASRDGNATIWNKGDTDQPEVIRHDFRLRQAAFLPGLVFSPGNTIITSGDGDMIQLWDAKSGSVLLRLGQKGPINTIAMSGDGAIVATGSGTGTVKIWNLQQRHDLTRISDPGAAIHSSDLSPDGNFAVTGAEDGSIRLWDLHRSSSQLLGKLGDTVYVAQISADGQRGLFATPDSMELWNLQSAARLGAIKFEQSINAATFSKTGNRILTRNRDGLQIWDGTTGKLARRLTGVGYWSDQDGAVAIPLGDSNSSRRARVVDEKSVRIYTNITTDVVLNGHTAKIVSLRSSPDKTRLLTASLDGTARLWNAQSGSAIAILKSGNLPVRFAEFSPKDDVILTADEQGSLLLWDAHNGARVSSLVGPSMVITSAGFSDNGETIVTAYSDGSARLWQTANRKNYATLIGNHAPVGVIHFCAHDQLLITGAGDGVVRAWNAQDGKLVSVLQGHTLPIRAIACGFSDTSVLTGSEDHSVRSWDVKNARMVVPPMQMSAVVRMVSAGEGDGADGRFTDVITGVDEAGQATIWDAANASQLHSGHPFDYFYITSWRFHLMENLLQQAWLTAQCAFGTQQQVVRKRFCVVISVQLPVLPGLPMGIPSQPVTTMKCVPGIWFTHSRSACYQQLAQKNAKQ